MRTGASVQEMQEWTALAERAVLAALPQRECEIVLQALWEGEPRRDVALRFGLRESTVDEYISRARKTMRAFAGTLGAMDAGLASALHFFQCDTAGMGQTAYAVIMKSTPTGDPDEAVKQALARTCSGACGADIYQAIWLGTPRRELAKARGKSYSTICRTIDVGMQALYQAASSSASLPGLWPLVVLLCESRAPGGMKRVYAGMKGVPN